MPDTAQLGSLILPFLSAFRKTNGPDLSGMTPEQPEPDVPPLQMPQQVQAAPQVTQQQPGDVSGLGDLTRPPQQDMGAPKLAGETKGHKLLRILLGGAAGAGAGAGQMTFGGGFQQATGTAQNRQLFPQQLERGALQNEQLRQTLPFLRAQQFASLGKTQAETEKATAEAQAIPTKVELEKAQAAAAPFKEVPGVGLVDVRTGKTVAGAVAPLSPEEAQVLGKQPGERVPIDLKNKASEIVNRGFTTINTEEGVYERNRGTGTMKRLGSNPRMMFAPGEKYVPVVDPKNPGNVLYRKVGDAAAQNLSSPQSATAQAVKATAKKATSGNWADQKIAFNTAIQHAELLRDAARALKNNDVNALNSLKNAFAREFGDPDITDFEAIANAYNHEITSVISKGHITDNEVKTGDRTLPMNANYETIDKVLKSYQALAQSKMKNLQEQIDKGMQGDTGSQTQAPPKKNPFR